MIEFKPRPYQKECLDIIHSKPNGAYLCQLATGLGKTAIFTHINFKRRMLILSHREELVTQPLKWFDCPVGIEQGNYHSNGEPVVSACVSSLVNRLDKFKRDDFDIIIVDECHHSGALTYKKIINYFKPDKLIGFTATPRRADGVRLDDVFTEIIYKKDIRWAIENKWLCDVHCLRVNIGYDLSAVSVRGGDYAPGELEEAMDGTADAIAEAYRDYANGATLIFAVSVAQCKEIAARIEGAVVVSGETKKRAKIIERFTRREIPCIVNCMVFTEGTDIPLVETVIVARPTRSESLYTQMVGRGLRLHPAKDRLILIDCVGVSGRLSLCTAPTLLGIDLEAVPKKEQERLEGDLFELPVLAAQLSDTPKSWIKNVQVVDLWRRKNRYDTHSMNLFYCPDGRLQVSVIGKDGKGKTLTIPAPDHLGNIPTIDGGQMTVQDALDRMFLHLVKNYSHCLFVWDLRKVKRWGKAPASEKQKKFIGKRFKEIDLETLTKGEASLIMNGLKAKIK